MTGLPGRFNLYSTLAGHCDAAAAAVPEPQRLPGCARRGAADPDGIAAVPHPLGPQRCGNRRSDAVGGPSGDMHSTASGYIRSTLQAEAPPSMFIPSTRHPTDELYKLAYMLDWCACAAGRKSGATPGAAGYRRVGRPPAAAHRTQKLGAALFCSDAAAGAHGFAGRFVGPHTPAGTSA